MVDQLKDVYSAVLDGNAAAAKSAVQTALAEGVPAETILKDGLISAMAEVGRLFEENEYFVPEMLVATRAMQGGLMLLKPHLADAGAASAGKVVVGTVKGDLHDIGKNLVAMMLEGSGFEVIDLGTDVTPEKFVKAALENRPKASEGPLVIGMSALLTTTMPSMTGTIRRTAGSRAARARESHDWRRSGDRWVRQADRRRRLQPGRQLCGAPRQEPRRRLNGDNDGHGACARF